MTEVLQQQCWVICWSNLNPIHQGNINKLRGTRRSLSGRLILTTCFFCDKRNDFANKKGRILQPYHPESFNNNKWHAPSSFTSMPTSQIHFSWVRKILLRSNLSREEFLITKFGLCIDMHSNTDNTLHGSRAVGKSWFSLQI